MNGLDDLEARGFAWAWVDWSFTDERVAEFLGVYTLTAVNVRSRLGLPEGEREDRKALPILWGRVPLGEHTDAEIARRVGCSHTTVVRIRRRMGIASTQHDWYSEPRLGVWPDDRLARAVGVTVWSVRMARARMGLPAPAAHGFAGLVDDWSKAG